MFNRARLESILAALPKLRIGLVGDLFLDRYLELAPEVHELSIETGLEAYQIERVRNAPGALGTVMNNLAALGIGSLVPVTVLGDDGHGYDLRQELARLPIDVSLVVTDAERLTPAYTKPLRRDADGKWRELNRLDIRSREPLRSSTVETLTDHVRDVFQRTDGVIVLDQINEDDWGVVNSTVRESIEAAVREFPSKLLFVDSRRHLSEFRCGMLKGNRQEVLGAAGLQGEAEEHVASALVVLSQRTDQPAFCTVGERGIQIAVPRFPPELVPGFPVDGPIDVVGAGDSASSGIVAALLAGATVREGAEFGNLVASITVQQLGTTGTASPAQLRARWQALRASKASGEA